MKRKDWIGKSIKELSEFRRQNLCDYAGKLPSVLLAYILGILYPCKTTLFIELFFVIRCMAVTDDIFYSKINNMIFYSKNSLEGIKLGTSYFRLIKELASFCTIMGWYNEMKVFAGITYMLET